MEKDEIFAAYEADPLAFVVEAERRARRMRNAVIRDWISGAWRRLNRKPEAVVKGKHDNRHAPAH